MKRTLIITGGAGFIGSHLVRSLVQKYPNYTLINLDKLTYAGNLANLKDIEQQPNYKFVKADISDLSQVQAIFQQYQPDGIIHLAAESHVDRSITDPLAFVKTNVEGTVNLLYAAQALWKDRTDVRFHHVSTDEVFGSLGNEGFFTETTPYDPRSPYSASKASSDHFVRAWLHTYQLPVILSNCSNNYGPYHFPEKLIPLMIANIIHEKPLPVYGKGDNIRDWLWVKDHCAAIDLIFHQGKIGESYNIGGKNEWKNIDLVHFLCDKMDQKLGRPEGYNRKLIRFVEDRAGHDKRYAIQPEKIETELGWSPSITFEQGLEETIDWYLANQDWVNQILSGSYQDYYEKQYKNR